MWKYNKAKHSVEKLVETEEKKGLYTYDKKEIPVQGKFDWDVKDGEDVTGKFKEQYEFLVTKEPEKWIRCDQPFYRSLGVQERSVAIPINIQEQPQDRKAYNSAKEMFNDIANGRDDVPDLQQQALEHISDYDLFNWDEALTENEFSYLLDLLMKFNPLCPPGSIRFEDQKRHIKNQSQEQPIKKEENS